MLEAVVEEGTAQNIKNTNYKIAGKTGTAQKIKNGVYSKNYYTSFCGYFPADRPKYSCIVVIDSPKGFKTYGADVSAPVFKEIADKIYAQDPEMHKSLKQEQKALEKVGTLSVPMVKAGNAQDLKFLCNKLGISNHGNDGEEWVEGTINQHAVKWTERVEKIGVVPNVLGMTLKDALYLLENLGLRVSISGKGRITSQSLAAGSRAIKGNGISLILNAKF